MKENKIQEKQYLQTTEQEKAQGAQKAAGLSSQGIVLDPKNQTIIGVQQVKKQSSQSVQNSLIQYQGLDSVQESKLYEKDPQSSNIVKSQDIEDATEHQRLTKKNVTVTAVPLTNQSQHNADAAEESKDKSEEQKEESSASLQEGANRGTSLPTNQSYSRVLRFCQILSHESIQISPSGLTASSTKQVHATAITNKAFSEGTHFWEIICPIHCTSLMIGVSSKTTGYTENILQKFNATSPRTIGVYLYLDKAEKIMDFYCNGILKRDRRMKIKSDHEWTPIVTFDQPDFQVILNPYMNSHSIKGSQDSSIYDLNNYLINNIEHTRTTIRETHLDGLVLKVVKFSTDLANHALKDAEISSHLIKPDVETKEFSHEQGQLKAILMKFKSQQDALAYLSKVYNKNFFYSRDVAKLFAKKDIEDLARRHSTSEDEANHLVESKTGLAHEEAVQSLKDFIVEQVDLKDDVKVLFNGSKALDSKKEELTKNFDEVKAKITKDLDNHPSCTHSQSINTTNDDHMNFQYLPHSDKLIVCQGSNIKSISRTQTGQFPTLSTQSARLDNYPKHSAQDLVDLHIKAEDVRDLLDLFDFQGISTLYLQTVTQFLSKFDAQTSTIRASYLDCLLASQILENFTMDQYGIYNEEAVNIDQKEILKDFNTEEKPKDEKKEHEGKVLSIIDLNKLLNITLSLEDQLWCMLQSDRVPQDVKSLWPTNASRLHSSYSRLNSLLSLPKSKDNETQDISPELLSDYGLLNTHESSFKLQHFQHMGVTLENVFSHDPNSSIQSQLEQQFQDNLMLQGMPSWNVPLSASLNSMPPAMHSKVGPLRQHIESQEAQEISQLKALSKSDLMMTCSEDGSVNVWSSKLGVNKVAMGNYKPINQSQNAKQIRNALLKLYNYENSQGQSLISLSCINQMEQQADGSDEKIKPKIDMNKGHVLIKTQKDKQAAEQQVPAESENQNKNDSEDFSNDLFAMFKSDDEYASGAEDNGEVLLTKAEKSKKYYESLKMYSSNLDFYHVLHNPQPLDLNLKEGEENKEKVEEESKSAEGTKADQNESGDEAEEDTSKIVPDMEMLSQLMLMGFSKDNASEALKKSKNKSVAVALELLIEMSKKEAEVQQEKSQEETKKKKLLPWSCPQCTFRNTDEKHQCEICWAQAPDNAYVIVEDDEEKKKEDQQKKDDEEKLREQQLKEQQEKEDKAKLKKQKYEEQLNKIKEETKEYYEQSKIKGYMLASVNEGKSKKPLFSGVVMHNKTTNRCDIHLSSVQYDSDYLINLGTTYSDLVNKKVSSSLKPNQIDENIQNILRYHQTLAETYYPTLVGYHDCEQSKVDQVQNLIESKPVMNFLDLGAIVLPGFTEVDNVVQMGDNLSSTQQVYLLVAGRKASGDSKQALVKISQGENNKEIFEIVSEDFKFTSKDTLLKDAQEIIYCNQTKKCLVIKSNEVIVADLLQESDPNMIVFDRASQDSKFLLQEGYLYVIDGQNIQKIVVSAKDQQKDTQDDKQQSDNNTSSQIKDYAQLEESVLKETIDPKNVTETDIVRYGSMMDGHIVQAKSNGTNRLGGATSSLEQSTRQYWEINNSSATQGPMEVQFNNPKSLISLNIDLHFNCQESQKLVKSFDKEPESSKKSEEENQISTENTTSEKKEDKPQPSSSDNNAEGQSSQKQLGLFQYQGIEESSASIQDSQSNSEQILPLVVAHNSGSQIKYTFTQNKMVIDNDQLFATNYPKPRFVFTHMDQKQMVIDKVIVKSMTNPRYGGYPIGEGLIFLSNSLEQFEKSQKFHNQKVEDYEKWKKERVNDPRPLREFEPVGYFLFQESTVVTIDLDCKRPSKYIMMMPTGLRQKPHKFHQNPDNVAVEIQFFGVVGQVVDSQGASNSQSYQLATHQSSNLLSANFDLKVNYLDSDQTIQMIQNIRIHDIRNFNESLHIASLSKLINDSSKVKLTGQSHLKLSDATLQSHKISGISVSIVPKDEQSIWALKGVSITGFEADDSRSQSQQQVQTAQSLFKNENIPSNFYRLTLMSPKYFGVINKVLAQMMSDNQYSISLRMTVIKLLTKILKENLQDFQQLVFEQINLESFLDNNILRQDKQVINQVCQFLSLLSTSPEFAQSLFELLLKKLDTVSDTFMSQKGFQAYMGMLNWTMKLDLNATSSKVMETLYNQVCLGKIKQLQTDQVVHFRTQFEQDCYPFDMVAFTATDKGLKAVDGEELGKVGKSSEQVGASNNMILKDNYYFESVQNQGHTQVFNVKFLKEVQVNSLKLYLNQITNKVQFRFQVIVRKPETNEVIFIQSFDEQCFSHFSVMPSEAGFEASLHANEGILLTFQNHKVAQLQVEVHFGLTTSSIQKSSDSYKSIPKQTMIEIYGLSSQEDKVIESHQKEYEELQKIVIDQKSKESSEAKDKPASTYKLEDISVGNAHQMIKIVESTKQLVQMIPQIEENAQVHKAEESESKNTESTDKKNDETETKKSQEEQSQIQTTQPSASFQSQFEPLLEELRGKIVNKDKSGVQDIIDKIKVLQTKQAQEDYKLMMKGQETKSKGTQECLQYQMHLSDNLTKIVQIILSEGKQSEEMTTQFKQVLRSLDKESGCIGEVALTIFRHYIARDSRSIQKQMLSFIRLSLMKYMDEKEEARFAFALLKEFLSKADSNISQLSIIHAIDVIEFPTDMLLRYACILIGIQKREEKDEDTFQKDSSADPTILLTSIMMLIIRQYENMFPADNLKVNEYDEGNIVNLYKHLYQVQSWICTSSDQASINSTQKTQLLIINLKTLIHLKNKIGLSGVQLDCLVQSKEDFININLCIMSMQNDSLTQVYREYLNQLHSFVDKMSEKTQNFINTFENPESTETTVEMNESNYKEAKANVKEIEEKTSSISQLFQYCGKILSWLLEIGTHHNTESTELNQEAYIQNYVKVLQSKCQDSRQLWLDQVNFVLKTYIDSHNIKAVKFAEQIEKIKKQMKVFESRKTAQSKDDDKEKSTKDKEDQNTQSQEKADVEDTQVSDALAEEEKAKENETVSQLSCELIMRLLNFLQKINKKQVESYPSEQSNEFSLEQMRLDSNFIQQVWTLTVQSLVTVSVDKLMDHSIFDLLIESFIESSLEIKQIIYPLILEITQKLIEQKKEQQEKIAQLIIKLVFTTLDSIEDSSSYQVSNKTTVPEKVAQQYEDQLKVGYCVVSGWLRILVCHQFEQVPKQMVQCTVETKISPKDIGFLMYKTSDYLMRHLNLGHFEGVTGANPQIGMRLRQANLMAYVSRYALSSNQQDKQSFVELLQMCETDEALREQFEQTVNNYLLWLFMNGIEDEDTKLFTGIGNSKPLTPSTSYLYKITLYVKNILEKIADSHNNQHVIKMSLTALSKIVSSINKHLVKLAEEKKIGSDSILRISQRCNRFYIQLLNLWLIDDKITNYFVFDLEGFKFQLNTIGQIQDKSSATAKTQEPESQSQQQIDSKPNQLSDIQSLILQDSSKEESKVDTLVSFLDSFKESKDFEFQPHKIESIIEKNAEGNAEGKSDSAQKSQSTNASEQKKSGNEDSSSGDFQDVKFELGDFKEYSNTMQLTQLSPKEANMQQYAKHDWSVNKRGYKHRLFIKTLKSQQYNHNEMWMLFKLPQVTLVKEIQVGFNNFWNTEHEVYAEPQIVLIQGGLEENNLNTICTLQIVKDDGFGYVSTTVFGKNMQTFQCKETDMNATIDSLIQTKLGSIPNFQVKYIKLITCTQIVSCLENSPLCSRQNVAVSIGVNYISVIGYRPSNNQDCAKYVKQEQMKTAMEVMSLICNGKHSKALQIIANQEDTIKIIKAQFNQLAKLVSLKTSLIEPYFISLSTYNKDLGDWMINQFLNTEGFEKHAALTGKIILCDKDEGLNRIRMLQTHLLECLDKIVSNDRSQYGTLLQKVLPFVQIYIKSLRSSSIQHQAYDVKVAEDKILNIFQLMSKSTQEREEQSTVLVELLIIMVCPPSNFTNSEVDVFSFVKNKLLQQNEDLEAIDQCQQYKNQIASIIAATRTDIAKHIFENRILFTQLLLEEGKCKLMDSQLMSHALSFWLNVSNDQFIKDQLRSLNVAEKLYVMIKDQAPQGEAQIDTQQKSLLRCDDTIGEEQIKILVQLLTTLSAGHEETETKLNDLVIKDLDYLAKHRDMKFVNEVFLKMINSEAQIPISFSTITKDGQEVILRNLDSEHQGDQKSGEEQIHSTFCPSTLFNKDQRNAFVKNFKHTISNQSISEMKELMQAKWICSYKVDTDTNDQLNLPTSDFYPMWKSIQEKGPTILLFQGETNTNEKITIGAFVSKKMPKTQELQYENDFPVLPQQEDFIFAYVGDHSFHHMQLADKTQFIVQLYTDDVGGAIFLADDLVVVPYSDAFSFMVLENSQGSSFQEFKFINEDINPSAKTSLSSVICDKLKFMEIWQTDLDQGSDQKVSEVSEHTLQMRALEKHIKIESPSSHPWLIEDNPYQHFKANSVFMVPSHLTIEQVMTNVITCEKLPESLAIGAHKIEANRTLMSYYKELAAKSDEFVKNNQILEIKFDYLEMLEKNKFENKETSLESSGSDSKQVNLRYETQKGLYTIFEKKGGVKKIIQVASESLKMWKDKAAAEKWSDWLKDLDQFSEISMFFAIFLDDVQCKELLFKVLSGEPDKSEEKKEGDSEASQVDWNKKHSEALQFNYKVLCDVFNKSTDPSLRDKALECGLLERVLNRLSSITREKPRVYEEDKTEEKEEQEEQQSQAASEQVDTLVKETVKNTEKKKRKGVGYSSKQGVTFDVKAYLENKQTRNEQIKILVDIIAYFLACKDWEATDELCELILQSALLPILEGACMNGSWLEMGKEHQVYLAYFNLCRSLSQHNKLIRCLIELGNNYKPVQITPIYKLLDKLKDLANIFLKCLNEQKNNQQDSEVSEKLARDVLKTYDMVIDAVETIKSTEQEENYIENALSLPLVQQYRLLLQDLRFDYMDMTDAKKKSDKPTFVHHYNNNAQNNQSPPSVKMVRLAQELADLSNALPYEHTNSIFVRVDNQRLDMMKAIITGACNTPYAHGCFVYDIFCENNYPNGPPKMNLMTTGNGSIRFNPNLYSCGKVCLSLLGTWRGNATENWDPKLSTILQVLLSTQAIIMSEEVYFNEPGFENEAGTVEGEKKNEGYMNVVRYGNIKFAMIDQLKKPAKGFESVIKRHFYCKKEEIMKEVNHWLDLANKNEAAYTGLIGDHNYTWCQQFKSSKTKYKEMLEAAIRELETELNKLEKPVSEIKPKKRVNKKQKNKKQAIDDGAVALDDIDMGTDDEGEGDGQIDTTNSKGKKKNDGKVIDIEDEAVKDRWSRYIGAMGVEAVAKQASANIFLSGAGAVGVEIAKNIILAGCKSFTLHDNQPITHKDLSGQFFLNYEEDVTKNKKATRGEACISRLQQLNFYVKCNLCEAKTIPLDVAELEKAPFNFHEQDVIILTEASNQTIEFVDEYCRKKNKKFIITDVYGVFSRIFNDFGEKFEVIDKNGEDLQDTMIQSISNDKQGVVELIHTHKHKFEDGDEVHITQVEGMKLLEGKKQIDEQVKSDSINDTIHKVRVISPYSFSIGDTTIYEKFERNGIAKQLKMKQIIKGKSFKESMTKGAAELPLDGNMQIADFEKMQNNVLSHISFEALDQFKQEHKRMPGVWSLEDAIKFKEIAVKIGLRYDEDLFKEELKQDSYENKFFHLFAFTCQGVFNPMTAFVGGFVAQEIVKAITQKFTPINQVFYYDASETLPDFDPTKHIQGEEGKDEKYFEEKYLKEQVKPFEKNHRSDGLRICLGDDLTQKIAYTQLFMVGAGAIGCELLKNYSMLGLGTGKPTADIKKSGKIVLTDPDIIEVSNLNRQFLFREKHLRKPKSQTAAAAAIYMNKELKGNIYARLDKVFDGTSHIFTDQFFEELDIVTNALDNIAARKYVDIRCVTAQTPLIESGTLGPKGHVQVIMPHKTESYGSQQDPEDNTEIPHCTLKMFPEETLHCVEWARDKFGKMFTQGPQNTLKILDEGENISVVSQQDLLSLKEGLKILKKRPKTFKDCVEHARKKFTKLFNHDQQQLLHVYPLDSKTKDGNPFWSLPKRPPTPCTFNKDDLLHCSFIAAMACLRATIFGIKIPHEKPRSDDFKKELGELASKFEEQKFVANSEKAKDIQKSVNKEETAKEENKEGDDQGEEEKKEEFDPNNVQNLIEDFKKVLKELPQDKKKLQEFITAEEFEKDNDQNYHIDLIYSMANCRASNYKLDKMDWITVKLKAGRIVPALATTTASIAGLQTLELVKVLKQSKKDDMRNCFLNLAVPIMQASEPGDVAKVKLTEEIKATLWDRWDVKNAKNMKLKQLIVHLEETYKGLLVRDVLQGNTALYLHALMNTAGQEKQRDLALNSTLYELTGSDADDSYVDLNVTCVRQLTPEEKEKAKAEQQEKILEGVPPVRVFFK